MALTFLNFFKTTPPPTVKLSNSSCISVYHLELENLPPPPILFAFVTTPFYMSLGDAVKPTPSAWCSTSLRADNSWTSLLERASPSSSEPSETFDNVAEKEDGDEEGEEEDAQLFTICLGS